MNVRWLWLDHVPPELHLTVNQRVELNRIIRERQAHWLPKMIAWPIGIILAFGFLAAWGGFIFVAIDKANKVAGLMIVLWYPLLWVSYAAVTTRSQRRHTYAALQEQGYEVCRSCGYWLRGLGADVKQCPECGAVREAMPHRDSPDQSP